MQEPQQNVVELSGYSSVGKVPGAIHDFQLSILEMLLQALSANQGNNFAFFPQIRSVGRSPICSMAAGMQADRACQLRAMAMP